MNLQLWSEMHFKLLKSPRNRSLQLAITRAFSWLQRVVAKCNDWLLIAICNVARFLKDFKRIYVETIIELTLLVTSKTELYTYIFEADPLFFIYVLYLEEVKSNIKYEGEFLKKITEILRNENIWLLSGRNQIF